MGEPANTPWLSTEEQQLLLDYLTRYFKQLKIHNPKAEALELFQMLEDKTQRQEAVRRITRVCDRATAWVGFTHDTNRIRHMLAYKLAKEGEFDKSVFEKFGLQVPQELVSDDEKALWDRYLEAQKQAWEIPAERLAVPALEALDAFCKKAASGECDMTLAEFLSLYEPQD